MIEHKEKYNRVLSPQVYLKIFDYFEEEYRFLVKDSEYKYFPEEAKHLAFTIKMGSSFGIDMLFPNKYTILSKEKNNFREDIKNKYF
ncbi:TPA: hypothetical protein DEP21_04480 [Patescibacteria group bacterium]|nr:hypothetical protein [Candidatus Gracilibacteria bacterium]